MQYLTAYCPRYSSKEEKQLIIRKNKGDIEARNQLVLSCLPWAIRLASKAYIKYRTVSFDELVSVAITEGLFYAVDMVDYKRGRLSTLVDRVVKQRLVYHIKKYSKVIALPQIDNDLSVNVKTESLNGLHNIEDKNFITEYDDTEEANYQLNIIADAITSGILTDKEIFILKERCNNKMLKEIGDQLGVTRERIRQIEEKALFKLKKYAYENKTSNNKNLTLQEIFVQNPPKGLL